MCYAQSTAKGQPARKRLHVKSVSEDWEVGEGGGGGGGKKKKKKKIISFSMDATKNKCVRSFKTLMEQHHGHQGHQGHQGLQTESSRACKDSAPRGGAGPLAGWECSRDPAPAPLLLLTGWSPPQSGWRPWQSGWRPRQWKAGLSCREARVRLASHSTADFSGLLVSEGPPQTMPSPALVRPAVTADGGDGGEAPARAGGDWVWRPGAEMTEGGEEEEEEKEEEGAREEEEEGEERTERGAGGEENTVVAGCQERDPLRPAATT